MKKSKKSPSALFPETSSSNLWGFDKKRHPQKSLPLFGFFLQSPMESY